MAVATRSKQSSTAEVVNILNYSGQTSSKKRKAPAAAHRSPGRPRKRSNIASKFHLAANGVDAKPAPQRAEKQDEVELKPTASTNTRLRNTRTSASSRKSDTAVKQARNEDMYDFPESPKTASPSAERQNSGKKGEFDLQDSVFDEVPTSKEVEGGSAKSPSQSTRSRTARATQSKATEPSSRPIGPVRTVHNPRPRVAVSDAAADDSIEIAASQRPSRNLRSRSQRRLKADPRDGEAVKDDSENLGYPSPEKSVSAKNKQRNAAGKPAVGSSAKLQPMSKRSETRLGNTGERDSDYVEEEGEEEEAAERSENDTANEEEEAEHNEAVDKEESSQQEHDGEAQTTDGQAREAHNDEGSQTAADTNNQESEPPRSWSKFDEAAELFDCGRYWTAAWDAAKKNQHKSDPETKPVRDLLEAIRRFKDALRMTVNGVHGQEEDLLSELDETDLEKIATAMGNLKKSASRTGEREERLIRDIYLQAIPSAVGLLRSILIVRSASGKLDVPALEELIIVLKATRRLCERVYHWKPGFHLEDQVKSRTNRDIKLSLKPIEEEYEAALSEFKAKEYIAKAKIREKEFAEKQAKLAEARERERLERRRNMAQWANEAAEAQSRMQPRDQIKRSPTVSSDHEIFDIDDLDLHDGPLATNGFTREATEDIPGPTKRLWQKEETIALLLLLQKYRGLDRYERIHKTISEIARDIRKLGADQILTMTENEWLDVDVGGVSDVLDDLGIMEVADIQQQAKYLKASQAREMERDVRATGNRGKWAWLATV